MGEPGEGGPGATGFRNGITRFVNAKPSSCCLGRGNEIKPFHAPGKEIPQGASGDKGKNVEDPSPGKEIPQGASGTNGHDEEDPTKPEVGLNFLSPSVTHIINEYKKMALVNSPQRVFGSHLLLPLIKLDQFTADKDFFTPTDLVNEFKGLEDLFFKLRSDVMFVHWYESLVLRIKAMSELHKKDADKKVLKYLYAAVMSKMRCMKRKKVYKNTVINLERSLDIATKQIKELTETKKQGAINTYRIEYNVHLNKKISDINNYIKDQVGPAIDTCFKQINANIRNLLAENVERQDEMNQQIVKNEEVQEKLQKQLIMKTIFSGVKIIGQVLSAVGGAAGIGGGIDGAKLMIQNHMFSPRR